MPHRIAFNNSRSRMSSVCQGNLIKVANLLLLQLHKMERPIPLKGSVEPTPELRRLGTFSEHFCIVGYSEIVFYKSNNVKFFRRLSDPFILYFTGIIVPFGKSILVGKTESAIFISIQKICLHL